MTEPADYVQSPLLANAGFRHAFFTRRGGVSSGAYRSLNFSATVGDAPENVAENLRRAAAALEVGVERVYYLSQVHGRSAFELPDDADVTQTRATEGDALFGASMGVACAVRTADCVPILVGERTSGYAAAVHAGWRGVVAQVIAATLVALRARVGHAGDFVAAIGPHISVAAFEISDDVAAELALSSPDPDVIDRTRGPKPHADLRRIVRAQLESLGVARDAIDDVAGCTVTEPERFFSFHHDGARSDRHLSTIVPTAR